MSGFGKSSRDNRCTSDAEQGNRRDSRRNLQILLGPMGDPTQHRMLSSPFVWLCRHQFDRTAISVWHRNAPPPDPVCMDMDNR